MTLSGRPLPDRHLGPDLLGPDWDPAEAVRRLSARPDRPVGEALIDQRNLAEVEVLYATEMLFLRGVNPWRPVGEVEDLHKAGPPGEERLRFWCPSCQR